VQSHIGKVLPVQTEVKPAVDADVINLFVLSI